MRGGYCATRPHFLCCLLCDEIYVLCEGAMMTFYLVAVSMATGVSCVALEDSTDEVAATRRHCRSLLVKLGSMVSDTEVQEVVKSCGVWHS